MGFSSIGPKHNFENVTQNLSQIEEAMEELSPELVARDVIAMGKVRELDSLSRQMFAAVGLTANSLLVRLREMKKEMGRTVLQFVKEEATSDLKSSPDLFVLDFKKKELKGSKGAKTDFGDNFTIKLEEEEHENFKVGQALTNEQFGLVITAHRAQSVIAPILKHAESGEGKKKGEEEKETPTAAGIAAQRREMTTEARKRRPPTEESQRGEKVTRGGKRVSAGSEFAASSTIEHERRSQKRLEKDKERIRDLEERDIEKQRLKGEAVQKDASTNVSGGKRKKKI